MTRVIKDAGTPPGASSATAAEGISWQPTVARAIVRRRHSTLS